MIYNRILFELEFVWIVFMMINAKRYYAIVFFTVLIFALFLGRLVQWQIFESEYFKRCAASFRSYIMKSPAIRGEILDRNGNVLAGNAIGYSLVVDDFNVPKGERKELMCKVMNLLDYLKINWNDNLPIVLNKGQYEFDEKKEREIKELKKYTKLDSNNPDDHINAISKKLKCEDLNKSLKRNICSMYYSTRSNSIISDDINEKAMSIISEFNFPGFRIETSSKRYYPDGTLAPHIIGYLGLMSDEEYEKRKNENYSMDSIIGKTGIEKLFEEKLRGFGGKQAIQFSKDGDVTDTVQLEQAKPGNSVFLTIDSKLQRIAQNSLEENVKSSAKKGSGCYSGSAVAIEVKTGKILAAASYPGFDLAKYNENKSYFTELLKDPRRPLLNRAFNGIYPPGSVFKTLTACAALQDGVLNGSDESIYCGGIFKPFKGKGIKCTGHHGGVSLFRALAKSCNVFFSTLGMRLGVERLFHYAEQFGIASKTGIELPESNGTIKNILKNKNKLGASHAAIGQGEVSVTTSQLAKLTLVIASGKNIKPRIVEKITNYTRENDVEIFPQEEKEIEVSPENFVLVRRGMREVVSSGLATDLRNFKVSVAAKTGTAQNSSGSNHKTFICYAPFDDPQIAVACILANGKYGSNVKAVCRDIMNGYF